MKETVEVAIPIPREGEFCYKVPDYLRDGIEIGKRVIVKFKNRKVLGFVVGFREPPEGVLLKEVIDIVDEEPLFDEKRLEFLRWVSRYYMCPLGTVLKASHPSGLGVSLRKIIRITEKGAKLLYSNKIRKEEQQVLKVLSLSGEINVRKLFTLVDGLNHEFLNSLRRRRLIEFDYKLYPSTGIKVEKIVVAKHGVGLSDTEKSRFPAKARILEFIITHGYVPYATLRETFGDPRQHIKWLEERGFVRIEKKEVIRDPFSHMKVIEDSPHVLNPDQEYALNRIKEAVLRGRFLPFLLYGVTGSGKTEVYIRAVEEVIKRNKEAIVLVPEISLTPQLVKRFRSRFGKNVAVIHSALSDGERFDAWRMARCGAVKVVVGARSAIFTPFTNIGIIVVDEEHESSYKQDEPPCYNARDLALVLGRMVNAVVILGSATPSVESYANAVKKKFDFISLPTRVEDRPLPQIEVVDMRKEKGKVFSKRLRDALVENFKEGKQTILFLNRRGLSTLVICQACGNILTCPNCSISLTYHRGNTLKCHYCGMSEEFFKNCNLCGKDLITLGMGTQKVEEELKLILPQARIARMDRDEVGGKLKLLKMYERLERGEIDILIGTQMVAKGHDLPGVTLVGVISADISLGIPDFRAGERTFQLITQVAGRAGRGMENGRVIVQTYNPEHPSIRFAVNHDSLGFLKEELKLRKELEYPPFSRMVNFRFQGRSRDETMKFAGVVRETVSKLASKLPLEVIDILGPSPCPVYKVKNWYRWQILMKSDSLKILHGFSRRLVKVFSEKRSARIRFFVDVDPLNFL